MQLRPTLLPTTNDCTHVDDLLAQYVAKVIEVLIYTLPTSSAAVDSLKPWYNYNS